LTLVIAIRCSDGAVIASDSRRTREPGSIGTECTKVFSARGAMTWGWSGSEGMAQEFTLRLMRKAASPLNREAGTRALAGAISELRRDLGDGMDAFTALVAWRPPGYSSGAVVRKVFSGTQSVFVEDFDAIGFAKARDLASFALSSMRFVDLRGIEVEQAKIVAYKVMNDVISVDLETVGGAVQMASIDSAGADVLDAQEIEAIRDAVAVWEARSRAALGVPERVPAQSDQPERGVPRPPRPNSSG